MRSTFVLMLAAVLTPLAALDASTSPEWKAATGSVVITPGKPMWMAGYAARDKPSEGTEQDLFAKVLILEDAAGTRLAIVTLDLISVPHGFREDVVAACRDRHGLPAESILLNASHTHCGPELRASKVRHYGIDAGREAQAIEYTRELTEKIVTLIGETLELLEPAKIEYAHGRAGFAMNRRLPTERGFINSPNPDGPVDHEVPVLKVLAENDELRGVLFGYACHNTTLSFYRFCGDYAGYAQEYLEEAHPGAVCLFLMGCGGDQNPYPRRELELAKQHGRALANAVETALEVRQPQPISGPLRVAVDDVTLQFQEPVEADLRQLAESGNRYQQRHAERLLAELAENGSIQTEYAFPVQAVQFGDDLTLVALPGETVVDYSLRLKRELAGGEANSHEPIARDRKDENDESVTRTDRPRVWVAGYSNYVFGYLPSLRVLREGGYEGGGAMVYSSFYPGPFTESVEERMIGKARELVERVRQTD
jgi:neutral ceramidase